MKLGTMNNVGMLNAFTQEPGFDVRRRQHRREAERKREKVEELGTQGEQDAENDTIKTRGKREDEWKMLRQGKAIVSHVFCELVLTLQRRFSLQRRTYCVFVSVSD